MCEQERAAADGVYASFAECKLYTQRPARARDHTVVRRDRLEFITPPTCSYYIIYCSEKNNNNNLSAGYDYVKNN